MVSRLTISTPAEIRSAILSPAQIYVYYNQSQPQLILHKKYRLCVSKVWDSSSRAGKYNLKALRYQG
ncbi:MAG: hypothetical protein F6K22_21080 [Okeania sp. SIO2F4]|uniref:hypothetical protein n=1 Tax=Okeania sp. SIO2F4 TaxID=2607790 RepID=UPI0014297DF7|nr:hypothetical protein [Okeania sp. SIO2F4]MDJ0515401.1 hypothetical protein [Trichodesmium sp. MO_231.B1]NES05098.1 hypothetical protein [Okeania sp. SIO2F4]